LLVGTLTLFIWGYFLNASCAGVRAAGWDVAARSLTMMVAIIFVFAAVDPLVQWLTPSENDFIGDIIIVVIMSALMLVIVLLTSCVTGPDLRGFERRLIAGRTFGLLTGHMAGLSFAHFFAGWQIDSYEVDRALLAYFIVPIALFVLVALLFISHVVREYIIHFDGRKSDRENLWAEIAAESELDAAAVCLSFITMIILRFWVSGIMPDRSGFEGIDTAQHPLWQSAALFGLGLTFLIFAILLTFICAEDAYEEEEPLGCEWWLKRPKLVVEKYFFFTTGWLWLISLHWFISSYLLPSEASPIEEFLAVAVCSTVLVLLSLVIMELIGEFFRRAGHRSGSEAVDDVMGAMGLVVGFSWERVYEQSLATVAADHANGNSFAQVLIKTVYGVIFTLCIVPALYLFVTPKALEENQFAMEEKYGPFPKVDPGEDDEEYDFPHEFAHAVAEHYHLPVDHEHKKGSAAELHLIEQEEEEETSESIRFWGLC